MQKPKLKPKIYTFFIYLISNVAMLKCIKKFFLYVNMNRFGLVS